MLGSSIRRVVVAIRGCDEFVVRVTGSSTLSSHSFATESLTRLLLPPRDWRLRVEDALSIRSTSVPSGRADTMLIDKPSAAIAGFEEQTDPDESCQSEDRDHGGTGVGA